MELAKYLLDGLSEFNNAKPDPLIEFYWPESLSSEVLKPDGN